MLNQPGVFVKGLVVLKAKALKISLRVLLGELELLDFYSEVFTKISLLTRLALRAVQLTLKLRHLSFEADFDRMGRRVPAVLSFYLHSTESITCGLHFSLECLDPLIALT